MGFFFSNCLSFHGFSCRGQIKPFINTCISPQVKSEDLFESIVANKISTESVPFGNGIIVSRVNNRAIVQSIHDADPIRKDVFTTILNNSYLLDLHLVMHGNDVFYFVKDNTWRVADDLTQLQRLGTNVNTTVHENKADDPRTGGHQVHIYVLIYVYIFIHDINHYEKQTIEEYIIFNEYSLHLFSIKSFI